VVSGIPLTKRLWWWFAIAISAPFFFPAFRYKSDVRAHCPKDGPVLLLANHTSAFDPVWCANLLPRNANFMASAALFRIPVLGTLIRWCGAFPKMKYVKDVESMQTLDRLYANGELIVMFPEGNRTWDGRQGPILPGIARLIKRINGRVMFTRIHNGHLYHPRWARWPRWMRIITTSSDPVTFDPSLSEDEIVARVAEALRIDPDVEAPPGTFGFWLAEGLPNYLWGCPQCGALDALKVPRKRRSEVHCEACGAGWELDTSCRMRPIAGPAEPLRVRTAFDRLAERYARPVAPGLGPGLVLDDAGSVRELPRDAPSREIGRGSLILSPKRLSLLDEAGATLWSVEVASLRAVSVEIGSRLQIRDESTLFELVPAKHSTLLWAWWLEHWRAEPSTGTPVPYGDGGEARPASDTH
jgi:1-acyl-sn-glycerol-3-phosphate acyltransferase